MDFRRSILCTCQFGLLKFDKKDNNAAEEDFSSLLPSHNKRIRNDNVGDVISILSCERDRISDLTDDILANILSRLTLKEAASTSVLSTRWKHLWTLYAGSFDFDESLIVMNLLFQLGLGSQPLDVETDRFVSWVNKVLESHRGPTVEEFRICFDLCSNSGDIDNWINFALQKRVRKLELDLTSSKICITDHHYAFPTHFLSNSNFTSLTSLYLTSVDVTGEDLEYLLCNCPFLEELGVFYSICLSSLKVSGPSLKLKHLEVGHCSFMQALEISAVNLVSLRYHGHKINVALKNVPSLLVVSFGGLYCKYVINNLCQLSSYLSRLQTLKLDLTQVCAFGADQYNIPELSNLKHLEMMVDVYNDDSLLPCASFLKACPSLYRFTLKLGHVIPLPEKVWNVTKDHPHHSLKVVEMVGFVGCTADVGFLMYLLDIAILLEKIIIDPCKPNLRGSARELLYRVCKEYLSARERAIELVAKLPLWEFMVL